MGKRRGRGEGSIEPLPSGSYRAEVSGGIDRETGKPVRHRKTFKRKADAVAWRDETRAKLGRGELGRPTSLTVGEWLTQWLELAKSKVAPKTHRTDASVVKLHVSPHLGAVKLRELRPIDVEKWLAGLHGAGLSQHLRHKAGRALRNSLNAAVRAGVLVASPMLRVKIPPPPVPDTHAMTPEELAKLVGAADRLGHGTLFRVWAETGLRPAELTGLVLEDFDPEAGALRVRRAVCSVTGKCKELKTKRSRRTIRLSPATAELVRESRTPGVLFPAPRGGHWHYRNFVKKVFNPVLKASGVARCTPYTLRHTMATLLLRSGVNLRAVSDRLGHADVALTLRTYTHALPDDQERAAAVMGGLLPPG